MRFFLDTLIGNGTDLNPFVPEHADGDDSILNLYPAQRLGKTLCLVGAEALVGPPVLDFGDDLDDVFGGNRKRQFGNALGLTLELDTLRGVITEIMLRHGSPLGDDSRWNNIQEDTFGNHKIWLGQGSLVYDAPVIKGIIRDSFAAGSDTDIESWTATGPDSGHTYTNLVDTFTVLAARDDCLASSGFSRRTRASTVMSTTDHYAQFVVDVWSGNDLAGIGPCVRMAPSNDSFYSGHNRERGDDQYRLFRVTNGTFVRIGVKTEALPNEPATFYVEVNGSSLDLKMNGTSELTATDTDHSGQTRVGILGGQASEITDFEADDISGAPVILARRALLGVGV